MKNFNGRFIEIDGIDVPILLEDGLDMEFAKYALLKCDIKEFKDGDVIIINKEKLRLLHKTQLLADKDNCSKDMWSFTIKMGKL